MISIVLNNGFLGMVRQWQELFYDKRYAMTCLDRKKDCPIICNDPTHDCPVYIPDFIKLSEGYSCYGKRITKHEDVASALAEAVKITTEKKQPVVLEFITEPEENVYPMVPAGASLDDMIDELV